MSWQLAAHWTALYEYGLTNSAQTATGLPDGQGGPPARASPVHTANRATGICAGYLAIMGTAILGRRWRLWTVIHPEQAGSTSSCVVTLRMLSACGTNSDPFMHGGRYSGAHELSRTYAKEERDPNTVGPLAVCCIQCIASCGQVLAGFDHHVC